MKRNAVLSRVVLALVIAMLAFGVMPAGASAAPSAKGGGKIALERAFAKERQRLARLEKSLNRADARAIKVEAWIAKQTAAGKNTTGLTTALAAFRSSVAEARSSWQSASDTITAAAGFDGAGKVTDEAAAKATVSSARDNLEKTRQKLVGAYGALRQAAKEFRRANRGTSDPEIPAEE